MHQLQQWTFSLLLGLLLIACDNSVTSETTESTVDSTSTQTVQEQPKIPQNVALGCKDLGEDEHGNPQNEVYLKVDDVEKKVGKILACAPITKEDYERHEIPATALAACGGWWAGAGDYFYAIIENNQVVVYKGWQEEEQEEPGFHWEKIAF